MPNAKTCAQRAVSAPFWSGTRGRRSFRSKIVRKELRARFSLFGDGSMRPSPSVTARITTGQHRVRMLTKAINEVHLAKSVYLRGHFANCGGVTPPRKPSGTPAKGVSTPASMSVDDRRFVDDACL
jgi:hypothetical protein